MAHDRDSVKSHLAKIEGQLAHIKFALWMLVVLVLLLLVAIAPGEGRQFVSAIGLGLLVCLVLV